MENKKKTSKNTEQTKKPSAKRKPLSPEMRNKLIIIITAAVLLVAIALSLVFTVIIPAWKKDARFDYLTSDLSKYIDLTSEQYKKYSMDLTIAKPREIDVEIALISMLAADKSEKPTNVDGVTLVDTEIGPGDIVNIYYRAYIEQDGIRKTVMSNINESTDGIYTSFILGEGKFPNENYPIRGVEAELARIFSEEKINPSEYRSLTKIKSGEVKDNYVIYFTFDRLEEGAEEKKTETGELERVDLTGDKLDEAYGVGFKDAIVGLTIGENYEYSFSTTLDGKKCNYTNVVINFATDCESDETREGEKPKLVVNGYYPYSTGYAAYNNKDITVDVYITSVVDYEIPALDDEYIKDKVLEVNSGLTLDELEEYDGDNLVEKYRSYAWAYLNEQYEAKLRSMIAKNMWNYYVKTANIKRVPGGKVDQIYLEYYQEVKDAFETSGGVVYNEQTETTESYEELSDYALIYLGLYDSDEDFTVTLRALAEDLVIERMIMYYIMRQEGISPTEEQLAAKIAEVKLDYMDEYVYQYLADFEKQREEFESSKVQSDREYAEKMDRIILAWKSRDTDNAEYAEFYAAREKEMFDYYDESHFVESAYYEWVTDYVVEWAEYTTLDGGAIK